MITEIPLQKKKITGYLFSTVLALLLTLGFGFESYAQQLAFPGAEGFGKYTTGGRGGDVYIVSNLNNEGPGSLREAVEADGPRTVLFNISGTIVLTEDLKIDNDDISIFGQSAPGEGIAVSGRSTVIDADNVIIQHMRFRPGDISTQDADGLDALWGREQKNIMLDHLSMSWSVDETGSFYDNENFTLQWSILSESMYKSTHGKGSHGYGGIWGGAGATFHHNLLAHHYSRNPRFNGSRYSGNPDAELVDFRNNVIYNWGGNSSYAGEGGSYNLVNNYFKPGPATSSNRSRIIQPYPDNGSNNQPAGVHGVFYINGNYVYDDPEVTNDNWEGVDMHSSFSNYGTTLEDIKSDTAFTVAPITEETAEEAFVHVLEYAGAVLPRRDEVDARIAVEVEKGTATFGGSYGSGTGIIDSQEEVGGWPELLTAEAPDDSDHDGMPDQWETENNLDPNDPSDSPEITASGYSNLELYIHSIETQGEFTPAPGSLELLYPTGVTDVSVNPEFMWSSASFAEQYEMQIRDGAGDYADIIFETTSDDTVFSYAAESSLQGDKTYFWRVRGVNEAGNGTWTNYAYFVTEMNTSNEREDGIPNEITLLQNYPNPFNPSTNIRYGLPQRTNVNIRVYDMTGKEVANLVSGVQSAGYHTIQFDATQLASGVYFYKINGTAVNNSDNQLFSITRKMTLIK